MYSLLALALFTFVLSLVLTPLVRRAALCAGWVDQPDHGRKLHRVPIPRVGGAAVMLACAGGCSLMLLSPLAGGAAVAASLPSILGLLPAVAVVFLTGLLDDILGLGPRLKFVGQFAAAGLAISVAGLRIHALGGLVLPAWLDIPITLLWLVGCANALNLIDGLDGLAAGVGLFATLTCLLSGLLQGNFTLALATCALAGALLGFLRYNFNPASIFLGDSGSLTVGFLLGCFALIWSQKSTTVLGLAAPVMALALPLLDTGLAIVRRFLRGQPIFSADRGHIHHRLLDRGLTPRRVAILLYGACGLAAAFSLLQSLASFHFAGLVVVLFCAAVWVAVQRLNYIEFRLASRLASPDTFRKILAQQLRLHALEDDLQKAESPDHCWDIVRGAAQEFGFSQVGLRLNGSVYSTPAVAGSAPHGEWTMNIPLDSHHSVTLGRPFQGEAEPMVVSRFADVLKKSLVGKFEEDLPAHRASSPYSQVSVNPELPYRKPKARSAAVGQGAQSV